MEKLVPGPHSRTRVARGVRCGPPASEPSSAQSSALLASMTTAGISAQLASMRGLPSTAP